jgi:hypothetical protein
MFDVKIGKSYNLIIKYIMKNNYKQIYITEEEDFITEQTNHLINVMKALDKKIHRQQIINGLINKKMKWSIIQNY